MKFRLTERGIVLAEFAIALPLLILLLGSLGIVTLNALKIAREQIADYALETEAQYVMDRITSDARATHKIEIGFSYAAIEKIEFTYHAISTKKIGVGESGAESYVDVLDRRVYVVNKTNRFMNAKRKDDGSATNPITGGNSYGKTFVTQFSFDKNKLYDKILHVTLELQNSVTEQKVKFSTSVYMPACKKIIYHEETILNEE